MQLRPLNNLIVSGRIAVAGLLLLIGGGAGANPDETARPARPALATTQKARTETIRIAEPGDLQVTLMTPANPSDHYPRATVKVYNVSSEDVIVGYEPGCVVVHCGPFEQRGPAMTFTRRREILRPRQPIEFEIPAGGWMRSPTTGEQDLFIPLPLPAGKYPTWATFQLNGSTELVESPHDSYVVP